MLFGNKKTQMIDAASAVTRHCLVILAVIASGVALYVLRDILTPLALAIFLTIMIDGFARVLSERAKVPLRVALPTAIVLSILNVFRRVWWPHQAELGRVEGLAGLHDLEAILAATPTEKQPRGFAIDPRGRFLLSVGLDSASMTVYAIDPATGHLFVIDRSVGPNRIAEVAGGGQEAMSVTTSGADAGKFESRFYHMVFGNELGRVKGHFGPINTLAFHPDGQSFTSGAEDGYLRLHRLAGNLPGPVEITKHLRLVEKQRAADAVKALRFPVGRQLAFAQREHHRAHAHRHLHQRRFFAELAEEGVGGGEWVRHVPVEDREIIVGFQGLDCGIGHFWLPGRNSDRLDSVKI